MNVAIESAESLPGCLRVRAERCGSDLAFRQKEQGLWRSHTWAELEVRVKALVAGLRSHGFLPGDRLLVDAGPLAATFQLCLAAQWLGGAVVVGDSGALPAPSAATNTEASAGARFAFAADDAARARLLAARAEGPPFTLGILLDGDDSPEVSGWLSFDELARAEGAAAPLSQIATEATLALLCYPSAAVDGPSPAQGAARAPQSFSHGVLLRDARALMAASGVDADEETLAWRDLPLAAQIETVLASWLVAGLRLNFVESPATEDGDRRELGPSLVFAAASGFSALSARTQANLPPATGRERRWLERVLTAKSGAGAFARRLLVHRLREVVGFGRLRRAVVLGGAAPATAEFQHLFGLPLREWPARRSEARAGSVPALASSGLLGLDTTGLDTTGFGAAPRSDIA
jgi:long-chain acyl-CoA synthetase